MKDIDDGIARLQQQYIAAARDRNVDALIRLYDPKARIFDAWGVWQYQGLDAWRVAIEGWFASHPSNQLRVGFSECTVLGSAELASMSAIVTYARTSADGQVQQSMQNRISWVVRTSGHQLRIVHEHTSAPIGFEDMKAILEKPAQA